MVKQAGAIPVIVAATEEADFKITAEQLDAAITDKTKVFMLNSPSNPTGMVYTKAELERSLRFAAAITSTLSRMRFTATLYMITMSSYRSLLWART